MIEDPAILALAQKAFRDVASRLPMNGRTIGPFTYFLEGFKAAMGSTRP